MRAMENIVYLCNNQQMHIYIYVQTRVGVLHQNVSATLVTISTVFCNRNTISAQTNVLDCIIKPLDITLDFCIIPYG